jgi:hypothetical protein
MDGRLSTEDFDAVVALALKGCREVAATMRRALLTHTRGLLAASGAVAAS